MSDAIRKGIGRLVAEVLRLRLLNAECERQRKEAWEQVALLKCREWTRQPPTREGYYWHAFQLGDNVWSIVPAWVYRIGPQLWVKGFMGKGRYAPSTPVDKELWARMEPPEAPQEG